MVKCKYCGSMQLLSAVLFLLSAAHFQELVRSPVCGIFLGVIDKTIQKLETDKILLFLKSKNFCLSKRSWPVCCSTIL